MAVVFKKTKKPEEAPVKPKRTWKTGPKGEAPGKTPGEDCGYVTVKLPPGGQVELAVWAKARRLTLRALFAQALQEFMAAPAADLTKRPALPRDQQEQVSVLVPMDLRNAITEFAKDHGTNKQTVITLAIDQFRSRARSPQ